MNRFDIVEAYYVYFVNFHGGQNSVEYKRLSKMLNYFTPRICASVAVGGAGAGGFTGLTYFP